MRSQNTRYLVGLDHVRAFASLLIVFYHGLHYISLMALPRWISPALLPDPDLSSQLYVAVVVLPVLLPLAALSYYVVERTFLQMRSRYLRPRSE